MSKLVTINFHKTFVNRLGARNFYLKMIRNDMLSDAHIELWIRKTAHVGYTQIVVKPSMSGFVYHLSHQQFIDISNDLADDSMFFCKQLKSTDPNIRKFRVRDHTHYDDIYDDYDGYDLSFAFSVQHDRATGRVKKSRSYADDFAIYRNKITSLTNKQRKTPHFKEYIDPHRLLISTSKKFDLDHRVSVHYGFVNDIDVELISSMANLEVLSKCDNIRKGIKCSMTIGVLLSEHKRLERILKNG